MAVEVRPVRAGDRVVRVENVLEHLHVRAMHALLLDLDRLDLELVAAEHLDLGRPAGRAAERRFDELPAVLAGRAGKPAGTSSSSSRAPSQTVSARDELEGERERVRHDLAQATDPQR